MIKAILKLAIFWLLFFLIQRVVFLAANYEDANFNPTAILIANQKAFSMDMATACYLIALPALLLIIHQFIASFHAVFNIIGYFNRSIIIICTFINIADSGIYKVWGTKLNGRALAYLSYPEEVLPTLIASENLGLLALMAILIFVLFKVYRFFHTSYFNSTSSPVARIALSLGIAGLLVVGMRGGLQRVPLNRNWVFHSPQAVLNYASLNGVWNIVDILTHPPDALVNPYTYFQPAEAKSIMTAMHHTEKDTSISISKVARPNIVFIFLESWNPDVMECYGGDSGVTPMYGKLAEEGILFTRFYATGYRTEQGLLAALSAFPAQPLSSIIHSFGRFDKLPNIIRTFNHHGYHTSFYSGGRLFFDNVEAYLRSAGVQKMMGENEFEIKRRTEWGAYDEETFALHLRELKQTPQPFFSALTTITTHEWFDADITKHFPKGNDEIGNNYRNTMHYADSCLYAYIQSAKQEPWYANTLFILVADHSCKFPTQRSNFDPERHHIPMLITGGALKKEWYGKRNDRIAMHTDLPATVLAQCNIKDSSFFRSKNLFNPYAPAFAYYAFDHGFGWISEDGTIVFDHIQQKEVLHPTIDSTQQRLINFGKAYLQTSYQENIDYAEKKK